MTGLSGGVLLGAGLVHMLVEGQENLEELNDMTQLPTGSVICGLGYIIVSCIEGLAFHGGVEHKEKHVVAAHQAAEHEGSALCVPFSDSAIHKIDERTPILQNPDVKRKQTVNSIHSINTVNSIHTINSYGSLPLDNTDTDKDVNSSIDDCCGKDKQDHGHDNNHGVNSDHGHSHDGENISHGDNHGHDGHGHSHDFGHGHTSSEKPKEKLSDKECCGENGEKVSHLSHTHTHGDPELHYHHVNFDAGKPWLSAVLVVALSVHSVFAGLALGIAQDRAQFAAVVIAILSHKFVESFSLG
eukprot:UN30280